MDAALDMHRLTLVKDVFQGRSYVCLVSREEEQEEHAGGVGDSWRLLDAALGYTQDMAKTDTRIIKRLELLL